MFASHPHLKLLIGSLLAMTPLLSSPAGAHENHAYGPLKNVAGVKTDDKSGCGPSAAPTLTDAQKLARQQFLLQPVSGAKAGSYAEVSRLLTRAEWKGLSKPHRARVAFMLHAARRGEDLPDYCFAPGTDLKTIGKMEFLQGSLLPFRVTTRWTKTATNPTVTQGRGFTLTWNIVADGTPLLINGANKPSVLRAKSRTAFGDATDNTLIARFTQMFARYEQLTGIRYAREMADDNAAITNSGSAAPGVIGTRADIRIGGASDDGPSKTLAFAYQPNNGDMVLDTDEPDSYTISNTYRGTISHEHGHGLGLDHVCPNNESKLMEPIATSRIVGPQLDDIQGVQRFYGDTNETGAGNETIATATDLGTITNQGRMYGTFPSVAVTAAGPVPQSYPYITTEQPVSLTGTGDVDVYKFNADTATRQTRISVIPAGEQYLEGGQNADSTCSAGAAFFPKFRMGLKIELVKADGQVIGQGTATGLGQTRSTPIVGLPGAGPYYIRISGVGSDAVQLYTINVEIASVSRQAPSVSAVISPRTPMSNATLTTTASATTNDGRPTTLSYQWFRNNFVIQGATMPMLDLTTVSGVNAGDNIRVEVVASGTAAGDTGNATDNVIVQETPSLVVTTVSDVVAQDGQTSLREAMNYAATLAGAQTITFQSGFSATINLASELPTIGKALTITGRAGVEISGQDNTRITTIAAAGSLTATDLVFKNGRRTNTDFGGLFLINGGTLTATSCTLKDSNVLNNGGAVFATQGSTVRLTRSTISNNKSGAGGAFYLEGTSLTLDTCVIANNSVTIAGNNGGAIYATQAGNNVNSSVSMLNCQVNNNTSAGGGGAVFIVGDGSTGKATNCTFSGNVASRGNGGAWADGNQSTPFVNCTFSGNTASVGGGAIYDFFQLRVVNCTFKGNVAPQGSAIGAANGQSSLQNNIFDATGQSTSIALPTGTGDTITSLGNNIASDGGGGFLTGTGDRINLAPGLGSLANNGGNVTTLALNAGSPALDKGSDVDAADINDNGNTTETISSIVTTDARGANFPRVVGGIIDIGAFEASLPNNPPKLNNATYTGSVNSSFSQQLPGTDADAGDTLTYSLASGFTLPAGLTLSGTGLIAGTPTTAGRTDFSVNVTDGKATITAKFIIIISAAGTDGVGPVLTRGPLVSSYTRAGLAGIVYTGTVRDVAQTANPVVAPVGVKQVLFQLRKPDGTAYSGNETDGFTANLNRGYFPAFLSPTDDGTNAGTSTFRRNFASFIPTTLPAGNYSLVILGQDKNNNFSVEVVPITITATPQNATSPFGVSGSANGS